ncbi:hypothetical protein [Streptomyces virginiae]|uniref:hypothetical protein n=1 Tax=Streptomyces virginiae TaxID=1961 RepID=UPI002DB98A7F|nr:hypothetical protein [Streptomyces sp. CMAA1738]MEC4570456.1 hypothetical protein [Streptomyces sp. CMAA1738]
MRTSTRVAGVLTGLTLALGGAALTAPAAHADVRDCINVVEKQLQGGEAPSYVVTACKTGQSGGHAGCVTALTKGGGVTNGTAVTACSAAP